LYNCAFGKKYKTNANIERDQTRNAIKKEAIRYFFDIVSLSCILKFLANLTIDLRKKYSGIIIRKRIGIKINKNVKGFHIMWLFINQKIKVPQIINKMEFSK
jgi:hypothetical protein